MNATCIDRYTTYIYIYMHVYIYICILAYALLFQCEFLIVYEYEQGKVYTFV